jgi:hypothetical protein
MEFDILDEIRQLKHYTIQMEHWRIDWIESRVEGFLRENKYLHDHIKQMNEVKPFDKWGA